MKECDYQVTSFSLAVSSTNFEGFRVWEELKPGRCTDLMHKFKCLLNVLLMEYKQEDHGPLYSPEKPVQNTFYQCYDYIITLIKRRKNPLYPFWELSWVVLICKTLSLLHLRMHCAKFGWNWLNGSWEEDFYILSMIFTTSLLSPLWKGCDPSFEKLEFPLS